MAHLILTKSEKMHSALASAPFDRQRDIFKLAQMGNAECRRLWNDFAAEDPASARLVMADVDDDKKVALKATKSVDKVLSKSEKKPRKRTRAGNPIPVQDFGSPYLREMSARYGKRA